MKKIDVKLAGQLWMDSPVFNAGNKQFSPKSRSDFGPTESVGLRVKRVGLKALVQPDDPDANETFGVYLGQQPDGSWVVATLAFPANGLSGGESFDSLEELQRRWELD